MKNLLKNISYKLLAILSVILISQTSVLADSNSTQANQSISGGTAAMYFAILLVLILAPVFKKSSSRA